MAGMAGIEPANDRVKVCCLTTWLHPNVLLVEGGRIELPNPKELIYSQPRLATSLPLRLITQQYMVDAKGLEPMTSAV